MIKKMKCISVFILLFILLSGCSGKEDTVTFTAEIVQVSETGILVETIDFTDFDKAWVDLGDAEYDFDLATGQIVEVTIKPEIRESYPVQVTGVKLVYKGEAERTVSDYFPIKDDLKYSYEGMGNEFASFDVYTEYTSDRKIQQRIDNGGTVTARVYEIRDDKLIRVFSKGEVYYRENMLNQQGDEEEILLSEPLEKGNSWTLKDGRERTITGLTTEIKTPMGTYSTIEVVTEGNDGTTVDYYAKGIGLVKTIFQSGGMEVSSTLESIEEAYSRVETIRFYYPDIVADRIYYEEKEVAYHTNSNTNEILEETYKGTADENLGVVLPTGAAIKSLTSDAEGRVLLDLNGAFLSEMNAGSAYEAMILQCIANTFGNYYNAVEVILTIEGKPYESGHIKMEEGQSIPVKLEGITEK